MLLYIKLIHSLARLLDFFLAVYQIQIRMP